MKNHSLHTIWRVHVFDEETSIFYWFPSAEAAQSAIGSLVKNNFYSVVLTPCDVGAAHKALVLAFVQQYASADAALGL